jgi:hypothetical protein
MKMNIRTNFENPSQEQVDIGLSPCSALTLGLDEKDWAGWNWKLKWDLSEINTLYGPGGR